MIPKKKSKNDSQQDKSFPVIDRSSARSRPGNNKKVYPFTLGQLIIMGSITLGCMVMVFLFGYAGGVKKGMSQALEDSGQRAVRLPVAKPIAPPNAESLAGIAAREVVEGKVIEASSEEGSADNKAEATKEKTEDKPYDFSASVVQDNKPAKTVALNKTAKETTKTKASENKETPAKTTKKPEEKKVEAKKVAKVEKPVEKKVAAVAASKLKTVGGVNAGWYVQLASLRTRGEALKLGSQLKGRGVATVIQEATVKNTKYFRLLVGPFSSKNGAALEKASLQKKLNFADPPIIKRVS